uniref:Uncharacterized protein n=1 Tax=Romanomermis culicivorax TaxID=13658 RepID=A0A915HEZ1_ROMCU
MILNGKQSVQNQNLVIIQVDNYEQIEKMIPENHILIEYLTNYSTLHLKYWNENVVCKVTNVPKMRTSRTNSNATTESSSSSANSECSY